MGLVFRQTDAHRELHGALFYREKRAENRERSNFPVTILLILFLSTADNAGDDERGKQDYQKNATRFHTFLPPAYYRIINKYQENLNVFFAVNINEGIGKCEHNFWKNP